MSSKSRILIVDDEPLNVKLFAAILSSDSYEIVRAFDGEQALKKVNEECPDLVLLDVMMPGIDGFEVTRRLKGSLETRDIPIILITAFDIADYKVIGHEAGADEFLNKPIKAPELRSRVKSLLRTKEYQDKFNLLTQTETHKSCHNQEAIFPADNDNPSVLLIFEEEHDSKSIKMYLHGQPYQVISEKTVKEAADLIYHRQIDLIIIDAMLQGEECFEICSRLKEREQTANTQILLVSELEHLEKQPDKFELWTDDFLIRPINVHELRARTKALLKKKTFLDRIYAGPEGSVHSAITDSLSGLANVSYLKYFLEQEIKRSLRDSRPFVLLMLELNGVRHNPNSVGHPAGEELLKDVGSIIKENIRDVDLGARYKELKFAIVLADTDGNGAGIVSERLKSLIINHFSKTAGNIPENSPVIHIGSAIYPSDGDSMYLLIDKAETALVESQNEVGH